MGFSEIGFPQLCLLFQQHLQEGQTVRGSHALLVGETDTVPATGRLLRGLRSPEILSHLLIFAKGFCP